ncbi:hypothetical protein Pcaca04_27980 [Pectobacterium carotovorum subsp. carotovorum]|nr:hypothetical protein Pcaca04_27980 [Pectobacterium carotovorum subsp. carotovorum]
MSSTTKTASEIAHAYVNAIAAKDVEKIVAISASDVVCTSPLGQIKGLDRFRDFQEGFAKMITNVTILAVHGDDSQAVVVYDAETYPVPHAVVAELIRVKNGKIVSTDVIYDGTPFVEYAKSAQPH